MHSIHIATQVRRRRGVIPPTYSSYSCLMGVSGQLTPRPRSTPTKGPPVPTVQEVWWASEPVWTHRLEEKSFASAGNWTLVVQSVVRHCAHWTTPAPMILYLQRMPHEAVYCIRYIPRRTNRLRDTSYAILLTGRRQTADCCWTRSAVFHFVSVWCSVTNFHIISMNKGNIDLARSGATQSNITLYSVLGWVPLELKLFWIQFKHGPCCCCWCCNANHMRKFKFLLNEIFSFSAFKN
jgi:hypothetical protein